MFLEEESGQGELPAIFAEKKLQRDVKMRKWVDEKAQDFSALLTK